VIGLEPSRIVVDVARFDRLTGRGDTAAFSEAMSLYQGDLLEGFSVDEPSFEDWLQVERERLRSRVIAVLRKLLAEHVREKVRDAAVDVAVRLLTFEPFDETVHRTLMRLYAESGRRSTALRQYEVCVDLLRRELGVEPEAETRDLYRRLVAERTPKTPVIARPQRKPTSCSGQLQGVDRPLPTTPLIGREADLMWLDALWQRSRREGPQLALIVGEAGIGKSRLVGELASRAQRRSDEFLLGRGREGEDVLPFAPWVEALRPVLSEPLLEQLAPVTRLDLARLFPELADGPGPPPSGIEEGPRIFEAVAHLLRLLATNQLLIVVIEDLHWCDEMTVRLLRFLPRRLAGRPVILLTTARSEELSDSSWRGAILEAFRRDECFTSHTLSPLPRDQALELFWTLVGARDADASKPLAERVWQLSEGNPFVVLECARAVRERGTGIPYDLLGLPHEVRALTVRQLTHLTAGAARLADVAAVIGRDFDMTVIGRAIGSNQVQLADNLEELIRRQVLRELDGGFEFRHDRIRETAYAHLVGARRSLLHRQVAEALETVYASDLSPHYGVIGTHYHHAGVWSKASDYLAHAGFQAWERGAGREALACFGKALAASTHLPDTEQRRELQVHLRMVANGASISIGNYDLGRHHLQEAEKLAGSLADRRWQSRVAAALSASYLASGAVDRALVTGERALDIALAIGQPRTAVVPRYVLGMCEGVAGNYRRSLRHLGTLWSDDVGGPEPRIYVPYWEHPRGMRASICYRMIISHTQLGEFDAGRRLAEQCFRESDAVGDPLGTLRLHAYVGLGKLETGAGDFGSAVRAYESASALCRDDFNGDLRHMIRWGLGLVYALLGRPREGLMLFDRADAAPFRSVRLLHYGLALIAAGHITEAAKVADEALALAREGQNRPSEAGAHGLLGEVARLQAPVDRDTMEAHLIIALKLAEMLEMRPLAARCHQRLAWLYERTGRDCDRHVKAATSLLEQMGNPRSLDAAAVH
jgi:tetratricopeptide (TPR) repeat protein